MKGEGRWEKEKGEVKNRGKKEKGQVERRIGHCKIKWLIRKLIVTSRTCHDIWAVHQPARP